MSQAEIDQAFMDGKQVERAFAFVQATYSRILCRHCRSRQTLGTICMFVVVATCGDCGGDTRIGSLAALWSPSEGPLVTHDGRRRT